MQAPQNEHTFGPSCHFARNVNPGKLAPVKGEEDMPPLQAQFFHASPLPIDDPLSALPPADSKPANYSMIPFGSYDNNALEEVWQSLSIDDKRKANGKMDRIGAKAYTLTQRATQKATGVTRRTRTADATKTPEDLMALRCKAISEIGQKHSTLHAMQEINKDPNAIPAEGAPTNVQPLAHLKPEASALPRQATNALQAVGPAQVADPVAFASGPTVCCKDLAKDVKIQHKILSAGQFRRRRDRKTDQALFMKEVVQEVHNQRNAPVVCDKAMTPQVVGSSSGLISPARQVLSKPNGPALSTSGAQVLPKPSGLTLGDATEERDLPNFVNVDAASDVSSLTETDSDVLTDYSGLFHQGDGTYETEVPLAPQPGKQSLDQAEMPNITPNDQSNAAGDKLTPVLESGSSRSPLDREGEKVRKAVEKHEQSRDHVRYQKHMQSEEHQKGDLDERHVRSREHRKAVEHAKTHSYDSVEGEILTATNTGGDVKIPAPTSGSDVKNPAVAPTPAAPYGASPAPADTTGNPFLRAIPFTRTKTPVTVQDDSDSCHDDVDHSGRYPGSQHRGESVVAGKESVHAKGCKATKSLKQSLEVPVGVSRLHLVKLPDLLMMPIYWSRLHDISAVTRGTWFHKDTMLPVDPAVANQLEKGYRELRPWSQTWQDELKSAIDVGAPGEEKVSHRLWPRDTPAVGKNVSPSSHDISADPYCAAMCFNGQAAASGTVDLGHPGASTPTSKPLIKRYPNSHVIYKDDRNAFILKTSLQPSAYYNRRPVAKIVNTNATVGIPVIRGFSWAIWDKLHPPKKTMPQKKAQESGIPQSGTADIVQNVCQACQKHESRPKVTDLVLVCHGIGQQLSERIEAYRFTHAVSAFRRAVNIEIANDEVQKVFREDLGGVMVLPVNWREGLSFEDGGPADCDQVKVDPNAYRLKDITPESIPAVRGFISEVLLDIPFYMSSHKPTMIRALIKEANRIYRLWCKNNPEFQKEGRVHFIGHSLGSVMLMEALSQQPTFITPGKLDMRPHKIAQKQFDFDCRNLFLCGSPAAFFLLLDKASLMPRAGREKPGAEPGDENIAGIASEKPQLGCLAVDNIYNIIHPNDPIAYRLNATIDPIYARFLKTAMVPSSAVSILSYMGKAVSSFIPGKSAPVSTNVGELAPATRPNMDRLPSQLEMGVHDFSREELAEKRAYRLNDNGQIDYFLNPGTATIEYLSMLGAHSSYWASNDFVRMMCTEIGRRMGRAGTLPNMRCVKVGPVAKRQEKPVAGTLSNP